MNKIVFAEPLDKEPRPEETPGRPDDENGAEETSGETGKTAPERSSAPDADGVGKTAPPKNYVAGDTVEFDIAAEEEQQQNTKQMNLFGEE